MQLANDGATDAFFDVTYVTDVLIFALQILRFWIFSLCLILRVFLSDSELTPSHIRTCQPRLDLYYIIMVGHCCVLLSNRPREEVSLQK